MIENLFQIRALFKVNDNQRIMTVEWTQVFHCPEGANAAIYQGGMGVIQRAVMNTTRQLPKNGGQAWTPVKYELFIFTAPEIAESGHLNGNTAPSPIWGWDFNSIGDAWWGLSNCIDSFKSYTKRKLQVYIPPLVSL
jgi:hypothetical protein